LAAEGKIHSRMASADANMLAGAISSDQDATKDDDIRGSAEPEGSRDGELEVEVERTRNEL